MRPDRDELFMQMARVVATCGTCDRRRVGAVLVLDGRVIATGYNGAPAGWEDCDRVGHQLVEVNGRLGCVRTVHAEQNAILQCAIHGISARGTTLYTTASTCYECAKSAAQVGVRRVVYCDVYDGRQSGAMDVLEQLRRFGIETHRLDMPR